MIVETSDDTAPARDLVVLTPSNDPVSPRPRAIWITQPGVVRAAVESGTLPDMDAQQGWIIPLRITHLLPGSTATVVALY